MKISVIKTVTARSGASTGADRITMLSPGFDADVEYLTGDGITSTGQELPNGDIWAKLAKQLKASSGQLRTAYVAVRVNATRYCQTVGDAPTGGKTYEQGRADERAFILREIQSLP